MIIRDAKSTRSAQKFVFIAFATICIVALVLLLFPKNNYQPKIVSPDSFYCDAETLEGDKFFSNGTYFGSGKTQNGDYSKSGNYSCFLNKGKGNQYGFGFKLPNFKPGELYNASVWRFREKGGDDGHLVVSGSGPGEFYKGTATIIKSVNNWELLEINFKIPVYDEVDEIHVYVFTEGNYPIYFDDLLVQKISDPLPVANELWAPKTLHLKLENKAYDKLNKKREAALRGGILQSSDDDWVTAKLYENDSEDPIKAKLRLKGDWLDHLHKNKWSFRIKTKTGDTFNRLRYFSIHTPKARHYLHEWVMHRMFEQEGILTTFYDFILVKLNQQNLGVYAIEEHFDKVLLERQKRREGPIVRFSEDGFWEGMKRQMTQFESTDHDLKMSIKTPQAAPVTPFQETKTISTPILKEQFEQAQVLMEQYKAGTRSAGDIFDLDKMAKYFAICDATGGYHGITWHNQRFYFNPVSNKLEPIGFDGFAEITPRKNYFTGMGAFNKKQANSESIEHFLFLDKEFTKFYTKYLYQYTSRPFLNKFFASIEEEMLPRKNFIQTEFEDYTFDKDQFMVNALRMHSLVLPFSEYSLRAFVQEENPNSKTIKVASYHGLPIELLGTSDNEKMIRDTFEKPYLMEAYYNRNAHNSKSLDKDSKLEISYGDMVNSFRRQHQIEYQSIKIPKSGNVIFYRPLGIDTVFQTNIYNYNLNEGLNIRQAIFEGIELSSNDLYSVTDQMVFFKRGKHTIKEAIIIPEGYRVLFEAGCEIDFVNKAKFISQSPVFMNGTEEEPIIIRSSDKSANGFTILQANQESSVNYVHFDSFNTLLEKGWTLTGAVTFYESDVKIHHSVFTNNVCEDGLNIIRSEFGLYNSLISNTFSDGFDADFCKGSIERTRFYNTGNDGMDFSGSIIFIDQCEVEKAGDKGVSVGEDTDASVVSLTVKSSNIAVAAKDLSTLVIADIIMENCSQGFVAFQKKPEFGGANIIVNKYSAKDVKRLHSIQENCVLQLLDKNIIGEPLNF